MQDQVQLRGIKVQAHCGATQEEREQLQPFEIDIDLDANQIKAGLSDSLSDAVNYAPVCELIEKIVAECQFNLMERFAQQIADAILDLDESIEAVTISVRKLEPPVPIDISSAGVRIHRSRISLSK